jgi:hypothetical protein
VLKSGVRFSFFFAASLALSACARTPRSAVPPNATSYLPTWERIAAQQNHLTVDEFRSRITVDAPRIECWDHGGTGRARVNDATGGGACRFVVRYHYALSWIALDETDHFFVRDDEGGPFATDASLRDAFAREPWYGRISEMHSLKNPLAFTSREDAVAAFMKRFGHAPQREIKWTVQHWVKSSDRSEHPAFEGESHDCAFERLMLESGNALNVEPYCFDDDPIVH